MAFSTEIQWSGQQLTMGELREFVTKTEHIFNAEFVSVTVDPVTSHPGDPGGTIYLSVVAEDQNR